MGGRMDRFVVGLSRNGYASKWQFLLFSPDLMMQIPQRAYPVNPYRFLIDRSSAKAHSLFPDRRTLSLGEAKLSEEVSDAAIVERAAELQAIIVTANGETFCKR